MTDPFPSLTLIPEEDWMAGDLIQKNLGINQTKRELLRARQDFLDLIDRARNVDPTDPGLADLLAFRDDRPKYVLTLQREREFFSGPYAEFLRNYYTGLRVAADQAFTEWQEAQKATRSQLVKLGYRDVPVTAGDPSYITNDMIHRHPSVRRTRDRYETLRANSSQSALIRANRAAIEAIDQQLTQLADRLAVSASL